jgi:Putative Ig domain
MGRRRLNSFFWRSVALMITSALGAGGQAIAQELVITPDHDVQLTGLAGDPVVVIADLAATLPQPPLIYVAPSTGQQVLKPQGLALFSANLALATHVAGYGPGSIDIIDTALAQRIDNFIITGYESDGLGTLAVNPAKTHLLVFSGLSNNKLFVVPAPFSSTSSATAVTMPTDGGTAQTRAIAFDNASGRAYVGHVNGISALDPPYTSIAFTIPLPPSSGYIPGRAVAMSSDGSILASTANSDAKVQVLRTPFSAASTPTTLAIGGAARLDGLTFMPDGSQLLVVDSGSPKVYAIAAPFDTNATIETLTASTVDQGYEDIDISADCKYAALSGGDENGDPLVILRAPFTGAGVSVLPVNIPPLYNGYDEFGGRGTGTARFWSAPLDAPPQIMADTFASKTEPDTGMSSLTITVRMSHAGSQPARVDFETADASPNISAPARYLSTAGTLTFALGETKKTISVPIVGNTVHDFSGFFFMNFSNPVNASLVGSAASVKSYIVDNDGTFIITTDSPLLDGVVGAPYSLTFIAQGGTGGYNSWDLFNSSLPSGLSLDAATGVVSGTPTTKGTSIFSVGVQDAAHSVSELRTYAITVGDDRIFADNFEGTPAVAGCQNSSQESHPSTSTTMQVTDSAPPLR